MSDIAENLLISTLGSIAAALLLYLFGRLLSGASVKRESALLRLGDWLSTPTGLALARPAEPPGRFFRRPFTPLIFASLLFGFLLLWVDAFYPPFGLPSLATVTMRGATPGSESALRAQGDYILRSAWRDAAQVLEEATSRAERLMASAAAEEKRLKEGGQTLSAQRVVQFAEDQARAQLEQARDQAKSIREAATASANRLFEQADRHARSSGWAFTGIAETVKAFFSLPLRTLALLAFLGFSSRLWNLGALAWPGVLGALLFSLALPAVSFAGGVIAFEFFIPLFIAAIVYAGSRARGSAFSALFASFPLIYSRFGAGLTLIAVQVGAVVLAGATGFWCGRFVSEWFLDEKTIYIGGDPSATYSLGGVALLGVFALEVCRCLAASAFLSVLSGRPVEAAEAGVDRPSVEGQA